MSTPTPRATSNGLRREDGHTLASFDPYFQAFLPSRYHHTAMTNLTGRPIDACYEQEPNGDRANGGLCSETTANGTLLVAFDDPRSPFDGIRRKVDINGNRINNDRGFHFSGPTIGAERDYGGAGTHPPN